MIDGKYLIFIHYLDLLITEYFITNIQPSKSITKSLQKALEESVM